MISGSPTVEFMESLVKHLLALMIVAGSFGIFFLLLLGKGNGCLDTPYLLGLLPILLGAVCSHYFRRRFK